VTRTPPTTTPDLVAAAALWHDYAATHPDAVAPAGEHAVAVWSDDVLGAVRHGVRRATAEPAAEFASRRDPLPRLGAHRVVCDGRGRPVLVLRTTELRIAGFRQVDADFAVDAGAADLREWRDRYRGEHEWADSDDGVAWVEGDEIVLERFRVVWPPEAAD
jgi:uncharacterized protein YhfF